MTLFKNKYRVESARFKDWDYSNNAAYFVTICTHDMRCYFGKIVKGKVEQSRIGKIAEEEWLHTGKVRDNVVLDEYVIMPNHIHGILMIMNDDTDVTPTSSLPNIIKGFKSSCTNRVLKLDKNFKWLPRYHDRIIRNEKELFYIREYISNNPVNWNQDKNTEDLTGKFLEKILEPLKNIRTDTRCASHE